MKTTRPQPLQWPASPSRLHHPILGRRQRWTEQHGRYRIERFLDDGDPLFIVAVRTDDDFRPVDHRRTLAAAKASCRKIERDRFAKKSARPVLRPGRAG